MTATADFLALAPWLVLAVTAVAVLILITAQRSHAATATTSVAGLVVALATIPLAGLAAPRQVTLLFMVDGFALFFLTLIVLAALAVVLLSFGPLRDSDQRREEHYLLLLLATTGAATLAASTHFASLLLGLETLSVALFTLAAYPVFRERPLEAGIKYLVLAGVSAAVLIFGMGLIYAQTGNMALTVPEQAGPFVLVGVVMIVVGLGFKLSLVPFHLWTPDVYQGTSPMVAAFLATVSKGAVFVLVLRYLVVANGTPPAMIGALSLVGIATIVAGNLLALLQSNLKRLLAYSSIAHMGYLMVPLVGGGPLAAESFAYYLAAYFVMTLMAFGVVTVVESESGERDHALHHYRGLAWQRPWLAAVLTVALLALAGIPVTAGFVAKFYLFVAGVNAQSWGLVAALVIGSALGIFYYLRVIAYLFAAPPSSRAHRVLRPFTLGHTTLWALLALLIYLGVLPAGLQSAFLTMAMASSS